MSKMTTLRFGVLVGVLALSLLISQPAQAAPIVVNGGFETGDFSGWTLLGDPLDLAWDFVSADNVHSGRYAADMQAWTDPSARTTMYQNLATTPGASYDLSFWLANDNFIPNAFTASWGGATVLALNNSQGFSYMQHVSKVVATGAVTELKFEFYQRDMYWHIDDIEVTRSSTPEPGSSMLLFGMGLAVLAAARRRMSK